MQPGDMQTTFADIEDLVTHIGSRSQPSIEDGLKLFIDWCLSYYG
jgi:UDP-glucuronate 4-epimerase